MKLTREVLSQCAYVALLIDTGACMSSNDSPGQPEQVEATGDTQDLRFGKKHKKKHHSDECAEPAACESLELHVDTHKHREATQVLDHAIRVHIPATLPALYWGSELQAELVLQHGDTRVVCSYDAQSHKRGRAVRALELDSCDNGAAAGDTITIDSTTLSLECSGWSVAFAKVHVKLHELEPCGETTCDPATIDDGDPCTVDACDPDGAVTHTPAADGTSCDDGNVCNGTECCQAGKCVGATGGPFECAGSASATVFSTDFEAATLPSEITPGTAQLTPVQGYAGIGSFAGSFLRAPTGTRVTLQLTGLPQHDKLDLRFLFAAIDSLDGSGKFPAGEAFVVRVDDVVIFSESFANALPTQVQSYVPPAGVELARRVALGFEPGGPETIFSDSAYDLGKDPVFAGLSHTASTVTISFEYVGEGIQPLESWAMDNLEVSVSDSGACENCGGAPPVVDDNNPCTSDSCDPVHGVVHEPVAAGISCGVDANVCDGSPICNAVGECVSSAPPVIDEDANPCTGVVCDPVTGVSEQNLPENTPCGADASCDAAGNCVDFN